MIDREKLAAAALSCGILKDSQLYQDLLEVVGKYEEISMTDTPTEGMKRKALKDMSPAELEHMELKAIADALAEAQRLLEGGAPAGRYSWLDAPVELAAARASTQPSRPQGGIGGARAVALKASACLATGTTTMASDPKEALERLKVDAGNPAVHTKPGELRNVDKALVDLADLRTLIAEREGLERRVTEVEAANESMSTALGFAQNARCAAEAEVERLRAENEALEKGGAEFWLERIRRGNERTYAAESRLSALEEALRAAADDWNNDTDMQDHVWAKVDTTELLALLHPTVPVEVADSGLAAADNNHMTDLLAVDEECGRVAEMLSIRHFSACWNSSGAYDLVTGAGFTHAADFLASVLRKAQEATKAAYKQGWNDREDDLILGAKRLGAPVQPHPDVTGLVEALTLILPMAKGYAGEHPVGNNREFANHAEATLAAFQSRQEEDIDK